MSSCIKNTPFIVTSLAFITLFCSCKKSFDANDYTAYFQGEIISPQENYVLFCKDNEVLDTLYLDQNNRFFKKFDSLSPGMYIYKHNPEYQYVYFDKNDSLNLRLNTRDFDHSIIFSGRGDQKNNFLMDLNTKNLVDRQRMYSQFDDPVNDFVRKNDSAHASKIAYYLRKKTEIGWDRDFDLYAKAMLDLHYFSKKEIYPLAHLMREKEDVRKKLPKDYYDYRKKIDFNNEKLSNFSSFTRYLSVMLNSIVDENEIEFVGKHSLDKNIDKLNVVDTLIKNQKIKNAVWNNIAFVYLLDDQNIIHNELFLKRYFELSTDKSQHNEIIQIQEAISNLKMEKRLPEIGLINTDGERVSINKIIDKPTVIFVWTKNSLGHFEASHKRAEELLALQPELEIISINLDTSQEEWVRIIGQYHYPHIRELRALNFQEIKDKWIITKVHRTLLLHRDGTINNAFVNLFDATLPKKIANTEKKN
ncbi:TlpA family protein disulfide reductase [Flavobacterium sp. JP2137]|uniref:TlpA family protein disulfide reductase n=1 Tax=Flavobacterium sp. JP2137 TaxID=3414510 RepID=UPI003D2FB5C3